MIIHTFVKRGLDQATDRAASVDSVVVSCFRFVWVCMVWQRWKSDPILDFDLTDPNLYKYPSTVEYNSLYDHHLRGYMASHRVIKILRRQGLVNRDGTIGCSLYEYNRYRMYLHELQMKAVKTKRVTMHTICN